MKRQQTADNWRGEGCQNYDDSQDILDDEVVGEDEGEEVDAGHFMNLLPEGNAKGRVKERRRIDDMKWLEDAVLQAAKDMYSAWKRRGSGPEPSLTTSLLRDLAIEGTGGLPENIKWMSKRQQDLMVLNALQKLKRKGLMEISIGMGQRGGEAKVWNPVSASADSVKTARGTPIKRYKNAVGKLVGPQLYVHKKYAADVVPAEKLSAAAEVFKEHGEFPYNSIMFDSKKDVVRFDEAPDFDTAREPRVGRYASVDLATGAVKEGKSDSIWHHKWLWVKDDYPGFDVDASREWSRKWASAMPEVAKGTERTFAEQLKKHNIAALLMAMADYFDPDGEVSASTYNAKARYKALNDKLFDGKLPDIPVTMRTLKRVGGKATAKVIRNSSGKAELVPNSIKIVLDSTFKRTPEQFDAVLVHEMIHVYCYVYGDIDEEHGPAFKAMAKKLGAILGTPIPLKDEIQNLEFEEGAAEKPVGVVMLRVDDRWVFALMNEKALRSNLSPLSVPHGAGPKLIGVTTDPYWVRKAKSMAEQRSTKLSFYRFNDAEESEGEAALRKGEILLDQTQQQKVAADFKRPHDGWKGLKKGIQPLPQPLEGHEKAWAKIATRLGINGARGVVQMAPVIGGRRRYHHRPLTSWLLPDKKTTLTLTRDKLEGQSWNRLKNKRHVAMPRVYDVFELRLTGVRASFWAIVHERLTWPVDPDWDLFIDSFFRWRAMQKDALKPATPEDLEGFLRFIIDPKKSDPVTTQRRRIETALPFKMMNDRRADIASRRKGVWSDPGLQQKIAWAKSTLKFLRENKIKHRDLDPSNLAKTLKGRTVVTNVAESRSKGHKIGRVGRIGRIARAAVPPVEHDPFGPTPAAPPLRTAQAVNFLLDPEAPLMEQLQILSAETRILVNTIHNDSDMRAAVQEAAFKVGFPPEMLLAGLEKLAALAEKSGGKSVYIAEACMNKLGKGIAMNPPLPMMGAADKGRRVVNAAMSDSEFWDVIEGIGWDGKRQDWTQIKKKLLTTLSPDQIEGLQDAFNKAKGALSKKVDAWEKNEELEAEEDGRKPREMGVGDDSFSDLISHIVGLGKKAYDAAMKTPELVYNRARGKGPEGFTESFSYAIPFKSDIENLSTKKYIDWAKGLVDEGYPLEPQDKQGGWGMPQIALPTSSQGKKDVKITQSALKLLADGDVQGFLEVQDEVIAAVTRLEKEIGSNRWAVLNLYSDIKAWTHTSKASSGPVSAAGWRKVKTPEQRSQAAQKAAKTRKARQVPVEVKVNGKLVAGAYYPSYNGEVDEAHIYFTSRSALKKKIGDLPMTRVAKYTDDYAYDNSVNYGKGATATLADLLKGATTVGLALDKPGQRYDDRVGWFLHVGYHHYESWDSSEPVEVQVRKTEAPAPVELPPMPRKMAASANYYKRKRHTRRVGKMQKIIDSLVEDPNAGAKDTNADIVQALRTAANHLDPR